MASRTDFEIGFRRHGPARRRTASSLRIIVLGDFSGRESRGVVEDLAARRPLDVDVDRLEQVMSRLEPRVRMHATSHELESDFVPRELEDFHPDRIFQSCEPFAKLQDLRARLQDSSTFDTAAAELRSLSIATAATGPGDDASSTANETDSAAVERLLGARPTDRGAPKPAGIADAFLREIVAPHIVPAPDPRQEIYGAAIEEAITAEMRRFLRDPDFRALETLWRSLHRLVTEIDVDEGYEVEIVDVSWPELERDARDAAGELDRSALHRALRDDGGDPDEAPGSLIVGAYSFGQGDVPVLALLGAVASDLGAPFLAAADPQLLGAASFSDLAHIEVGDDRPNGEAWEALRASPLAAWIGLALPGVLARLPYGAKTDPIDAFPFEELEDPNDLTGVLWGNAAFVCAELIAGVFAEEGSVGLPPAGSELQDLPAFVFTVDGERRLLPCAQVLLPDAGVETLLSLGLIPMMSHRSRNVVRVHRIVSLSGEDLAGPW